jgi:hypothetical protein
VGKILFCTWFKLAKRGAPLPKKEMVGMNIIDLLKSFKKRGSV